MQRINYKDVFKGAKIRKYQLLREKNMIFCDYHISEGCDECMYKLKCGIKEVSV